MNHSDNDSVSAVKPETFKSASGNFDELFGESE